MESPPTGTVTFLFTDIEGSTRRWQDEPEAMRALLVEHDAIFREVIGKHRGHLFKHTGDGVAAVFASAADACAAAVDAQECLREVLPVRMGLHTGEAEFRDGDYFGSTLNRCARLMGVAHGGQIVCSGATAELVRDRDDLRDLGEHRLRDLSRAEHVCQVGGGEFAALRSLTAASTNLPLQLSSFVGRETELAEVATAVRDARLVTLTGVGGVGKTRLALQVAGEVLPRFADGVWVAELAAAANSDDMAQVVALALGVVRRQQMTLAESIVDFLRTRELLVVLDNCEHLLDATTTLVEGILAGAPRVRILATSREGFGIPGERVRPLRSLSVSGDDAASSDAVVLFVERAEAVAPGFALNAQSTPAVVELCRRLDGIPLAIELAAARVGVMTPAEIVAHLDERFRLLTGGRRGRVERHQTLRAAIEWSYSMLGETERSVFDCLGVFPSSFDEPAAVAVCAGDGVERWDVIDALASLVAKSMVGAERDSGSTRYQLLETLRHFARDHVDDIDARRRRHATHYAAVAEQAGKGLYSPDELAWRFRIGQELDNLRTATSWAFDAVESGDVEIGARIVDALVFESIQNLSWGVQAWATHGLERVRELDAGWRASVLAAAGGEIYGRGDYERASALSRLALDESVRFDRAYYVALSWVSADAAMRGDVSGMMAVFSEGRHMLETAPEDEEWSSCALAGLIGVLAHFVDDMDLARTEARQAVAGARALGVPSTLASVLMVDGHLYCNDDPAYARSQLTEAIALFEAGAADSLLAPALMDVGVLCAAADDVTGASAAMRSSLRNAVRNGDRPKARDAVVASTVVLARRRECGEAAAALTGACHGAVLGQIPPTYARIHEARIAAAAAQVEHELGADVYQAAFQRGAAMTYDEIIAFTLDQLAQLAKQ